MMATRTKSVCVVGLGYIGLPTAALLSNSGYKVFGVDTNPLAVETINKGEIHIVEPELDVFVKSVLRSAFFRLFLFMKLEMSSILLQIEMLHHFPEEAT